MASWSRTIAPGYGDLTIGGAELEQLKSLSILAVTLCLLYKIYHRVDHPMNEHLNNFVTARNTMASAALGELALVIPRCRID